MIEYLPPKPPKTNGYIEKMGKLVLNFHKRYIEIDPVGGLLLRFKTLNDYPSNPM